MTVKSVAAIPVPQLDENNASVLYWTADDRPGIRHIKGYKPEILNSVGMALGVTTKLKIFVHARRVVILLEIKTKSKYVHRDAGALVLHPVTAPHLTELAGIAAEHVKYDARSNELRRCDCPRDVAEGYLARGHWPELPPLSSFVETPTIDCSGRLIEHGYDEETEIYVACNEAALPGYKRPPDKPTKKDAAEMSAVLCEPVDSFPFLGPEDRSATIAAILTALVRRILPSAPMFAVTAPMPGTGKTLLAETAAIIATGRRASVLSLGHDDAELEKRLHSAYLAGDAVIMLDNIERPLGGELLCQATTQPFLEIRPLGGSNKLTVPTHALLLATGNNLSIVGDLKRRTVLIRMDAKTERPEQRRFGRNHIEDVIARRGELISAALTIPMAYLAAGAPAIEGHFPAGSFEEWDRLVRRPLLWLGYPDPLGGAEALRESDPDLEAMRALFNAWMDIPRLNGPRTVAEIVNVGMEYLPGGGDPACPELRDALQLVCSEKVNSRRLGYWLRAHRDRIIDGMQLLRAGEDGHSRAATWRVVKC